MKYPGQIAYPFLPGQFHTPVIKDVATQSVIKARWPDGSAKHVIFSFILDGNIGDIRNVPFIEGQSVSLGAFPVNAVIEMNGIQVSCNDLPFTSWLPNSYIYADHTGAHDIPSPSGTKARPIFFITYYPEIGNAHVRFMLENASTTAAGECLAPTRFLINGTEVFSNLGLTWDQQMIPIAGRFTKPRWISPRGILAPKFDLAHLIACNAIPNFDTSITVSPTAIANMYQLWLSSDKNIANKASNQWGLFAKAMGTAGARTDLGPYPTWSTLWLYSGDARMLEVDTQSCDLAAMFALHYRESDPARANFGKPFRITDRPKLQGSLPFNGIDGFKTVSDPDPWGLRPDPAHEVNPFYLRYLLGGEFFHLEEMMFFEGFCAGYPNGAATTSFLGRGPTGKEGGLPGARGAAFQIRGQGWVLRGRSQLAWVCPDDLSEKNYFTKLTNDAIAIWEGQRGIGDLTESLHKWGRDWDPQDSPIRLWDKGNSGLVGEPIDWSKSASAISPWEVSILVYALLLAKQYGFATQPLIDWLKPSIQAMHKLLSAYRVSTSDSANQYLTSWEQVRSSMVSWFDEDANWKFQINMDHGYTLLALSQIIALGDPVLWAEWKTNIYDKMNWASNPKLAFLPRLK